MRRAKLLARLAETESSSIEQVDGVAQKLKLSRASVYRLLARFKDSREATSLLPAAPGRKNGAKELGVDQEKIIHAWIEKFYLSRQRPSVAALHRTIALECFQAKLEVPSYNAVRSRVNSLNAVDVVRAREGARAANQFGSRCLSGNFGRSRSARKRKKFSTHGLLGWRPCMACHQCISCPTQLALTIRRRWCE